MRLWCAGDVGVVRSGEKGRTQFRLLLVCGLWWQRARARACVRLQGEPPFDCRSISTHSIFPTASEQARLAEAASILNIKDELRETR